MCFCFIMFLNENKKSVLCNLSLWSGWNFKSLYHNPVICTLQKQIKSYFKDLFSLAALIQFQSHISHSAFTSGAMRPSTSPAPNTTQRLQTCSAYLRQNRECTYPPPGNVLSWGQAASSCAQRKVFLSGLRNLAGWATGTSWLAARPGPERRVTWAFYCTSVKHFSAPLQPLSVPHCSAESPHTFKTVWLHLWRLYTIHNPWYG